MKRIIICADGTWNNRDQVDQKTKKRRPTNVTKLARAIPPEAGDVSQVVIYHEGVGTGGPLDKITGGAFGDGVERNVRDLYRSILYNYADGDELFLFGFSRGAFTVRTLAGFLNAVGLLEKQDDYWLPEVYGCYQNGAKPGSAAWQQAFHGVRGQSRFPTIRFIGVWDTVGALGAPGALGQLLNRNKYQYHDISLNDHIVSAAQALAIEERRKPFAPSVWERPAGWKGTLQQAWFPGVHSDVGGGYTPDGLANEALHWIVECAKAEGLAVDDAFLAPYQACFNSVLHDSMSFKYRLLGTILRPIGKADSASEGLHQATEDRQHMTSLAYAPKNVADYKAAGGQRVYGTPNVARGQPCPAFEKTP
ncbi:MAG: DUF2235 domain-containing protein [Gemmatimonadetes bacterium]|nr:DUF2235 domain-containing protein [Gemmatimonadota bacterium]